MVASSAQCTSSITATVAVPAGPVLAGPVLAGPVLAGAVLSGAVLSGAVPISARNAANSRSLGTPARAARLASSPLAWAAMSNSGPSGRGVISRSQPPHSQRSSGDRRWKASSSAVLPIPDSPYTRTRRPEPCRASAAYSASVARNGSRSSSSIPEPPGPDGDRVAAAARVRAPRGLALGHGPAPRTVQLGLTARAPTVILSYDYR